MSEELKPCPFCGGEAHISTRMDEDIWSHNTVPYTRVACGDCDIGTDYLCEGWEPTAIESWNRRVGAAVCGWDNVANACVSAECHCKSSAPGATDAERAEWLADKIVAQGDYAKEAAMMLRRWPDGVPMAAAPVMAGKSVLTDEQWRAAKESSNPFLRCGCGATMPCTEHYTRGAGNGERERFEEWAAPRCLHLPKRPDGEYASVTTQEAWDAWQSRAALKEQEEQHG